LDQNRHGSIAGQGPEQRLIQIPQEEKTEKGILGQVGGTADEWGQREKNVYRGWVSHRYLPQKQDDIPQKKSWTNGPRDS